MRCPRCGASELAREHRAGIEIDVCPRCGGIWLDRGELGALTDLMLASQRYAADLAEDGDDDLITWGSGPLGSARGIAGPR